MSDKSNIVVFRKDKAIEFGVNAAIVLDELFNFYPREHAGNVQYKDDKYWVVVSIGSLLSAIPYLSRPKIRKAINILKEANIIQVECYNTDPTDTTKWYHMIENSLTKGD